MPRKSIKTQSTYKAPPLDQEEFRTLYNALYAVFGSLRKAAQALDISYPTYLKWEHKPPTWPYYNMVMEQVLRAKLRGLKIDRRSFTSKQHYRYTQALGQLKQSTQILDELEGQVDHIKEASDYLRQKLIRKGIFFDELIKPAHSGGYSPRSLRRAARKLGVVMDTRGFGTDKRSYWKLPTLQSDEDYDQ